MIITSIEVEGVGKFGTATRVIGLDKGVNILAAGNEAGKSTIFKAVRACIFERHDSKNSAVMSLATSGASLPVSVTVNFNEAGRSYSIRKSFVRSVSASLIRDKVEIARDRQADEMAWEVLGLSQGGGRSIDHAAFGLLWVGQRQSFAVPEPTEGATTVLNGVIQAEVGTMVGGERARSVLSALTDELSALVTARGSAKAGSVLAHAEANLEKVSGELNAAEHRLKVLEAQLRELEARRKERARISDPALVAQMSAELHQATRDLIAGNEASSELAKADANEQRAKVILNQASQRIEELNARAKRIDHDRRLEVELNEALINLDAKEKAARDTIRHARDQVAVLNAEIARQDEEERTLSKIADTHLRLEKRGDLAKRLSSLEVLTERQIKNVAALESNRVTATIISTLDEIERDLAVLAARLEAASPQIEIQLGPEGAGHILIGGKPVTENLLHAAVEQTTINISDIATVIVSPALGAEHGDYEKQTKHQAKLTKLLADMGAATAGELRARRTRREQLESEGTSLLAELTAFSIADKSPVSAIDEVRLEIEAIDALVREALFDTGLNELPPASEIASRRDELWRKREAARPAREKLSGAIDAQNTILEQIADDRGQHNGRLTEIKNRLQADLIVLPDGDRARLMSEAETEFAGVHEDYNRNAQMLNEQRKKSPTLEEIERRQIKLSRLKSSLENQRSAAASLDNTIANLEGQIQSAGGDGLGERVDMLRQEKDVAQREVNRHRYRVSVLQLLQETVDTCYREQRDRLHEPLRRHLRPFLADVFPSAEIQLGDGFSVTGIKRNGSGAENIERLSDGTQEQIAVLVRLAMGGMISELNHDVPIILDDALVYSDDDRIEQMFDALNRAGRTQQVIVMTCRTRTFAALGGRQLSLEIPTTGSD